MQRRVAVGLYVLLAGLWLGHLVAVSAPVANLARIVEGLSLHLFAALFLAWGVLAVQGPRRVWVWGLLVCLVVTGGILFRPFVGLPERAGNSDLRVLSVNILGDNFSNATAVLEAIETSDADVVVILENDPLQPFVERLYETYPYRLEPALKGTMWVVSRLPIQAQEMFRLSWKNRQKLGFVQITLAPDQVVNVVAVHLTKSWLLEMPQEELDAVVAALETLDGPVVVAGDFNAPGWSQSLRYISARSEVSFRRLSPATWPRWLGAWGIPIDHVAVGGGAQVHKVTAWTGAVGSNHRGLMADIFVPVGAPEVAD